VSYKRATFSRYFYEGVVGWKDRTADKWRTLIVFSAFTLSRSNSSPEIIFHPNSAESKTPRTIAATHRLVLVLAFIRTSLASDVIPDRYIITLRQGISQTVAGAYVQWATETHRRSLSRQPTTIRGVQRTLKWSDLGLHTYVGKFDDESISEIRNSDDVAAVETDTYWTVDEPYERNDQRSVPTARSLDPMTRHSRPQKRQNHVTVHLAPRTLGPRQQSYRTPYHCDKYIFDAHAGIDTFGYVAVTGIDIDHTDFG